MIIKYLYIGLVVIAEIFSFYLAYHYIPSSTMPLFIPMLIGVIGFLCIMVAIHSFKLRSYLYTNHHDTFQAVTDYTSLFGNGTYNVPSYYRFLFSKMNEGDIELQKRKTIIKTLFILIPILFIATPLNIAIIYYAHQ